MYILLALDPVHIGTGGYRLGRVDNTIVREPGTNLPKIPATSLCGPLRSFMALRNDKFPQCAGQGQAPEGNENAGIFAHCGKYDCPVCVGFGFSHSRNSFQGMIQLSDAHLLFYPVYSRLGPIWVTSPSVLMAALMNLGVITEKNSQEEIFVDEGTIKSTVEMKLKGGAKLNLGWLLLQVDEMSFSLPEKFKSCIPKYIANKMVLVSDKLFPLIVNDNLEVRTSVSINPVTGAAKEGALFTYEAIPRATVMQCVVTINDPSFYRIPPDGQEPSIKKEDLNKKLYEAAEYMQWLGIGGMNTRGMGRMRVISPCYGGEE
ncbi:MAG: type III-B CRISPR module RAMP protein Cmr4 [Bacteroidales bacterium]|nr:type III-B CRISPR module RAMP protein Cmr4 [Bacteroidales bacterium]